MTELTENEFERFHNHIVFRCDLYNVFYFPEFLQGLTIIPYNSKFSYCFSNHLSISISNFFNNPVKQHWTIRQGRNNRRGPERQNELLQVTEYNKHLLCQALCVCVCVCVYTNAWSQGNRDISSCSGVCYHLHTQCQKSVCFTYFTNISLLNIHVFILFFGCGGSSLLHMGFSLVAARQGLLTSCSAWTHCGGFSYCRAQAQGEWAQWLWHKGAQLFLSMWDLPVPGIELVSPVLQSEFLTTGPPGKPHKYLLIA